MKGASRTARGIAKAANGAAIDINSLKNAMQGSTAAIFATRAAAFALNAAISIGLSVAISWVVEKVIYFIHYEENLQKKTEELSEKIQGLSNEIKDLQTTANETIPRFLELAKGVDSLGQNVDLPEDEYKEFLDINNELAELFPQLDLGLDENGNHILALSYNVDALTESLNDLISAQKELLTSEMADTFSDLFDNVQKTDRQIDKNIKSINRDKSFAKRTYEKVLNFPTDSSLELSNKETNLLQEIAGSISEINYDNDIISLNRSKWTQNDYDKLKRGYDNYVAGLDKKIERENGKKSTNNNRLNPVIQTLLQSGSFDVSGYEYNELSDGIQKVISSVLSKTSFAGLSEAQAKNKIREIVNLFFDLDDDKKDLLTNLFEFSQDDYETVGEYLDAVLNAMAEILEGVDIENFDIGLLKQLLGVDTVEGKINGIMSGVSDISDSHDLRAFRKQIESLSLNELNIVYDFIAENGSATVDEIQSLLNNTQSVEIEIDTPTSVYSRVQKLQDGFKLLGEVYDDIKDKGDFDWSKILNNDDFENAFKEYADSYENFRKTVTENPDDIEACQEAFNQLATEYVLNSDKLKGLTKDTRDATVAMLEQMGVTNAAAFVDQLLADKTMQLADYKVLLKLQAMDLESATYDEIDALYAECTAGSTAQEVLGTLRGQKALLNGVKIDTSDDIDQVIALANAAGATTLQLRDLARAKMVIAKAESMAGTAAGFRYMNSDEYAEAQELIKEIENGTGKYNTKIYDPNDFKVSSISWGGSGSGGSGSGSGGSGSGSGSSDAKDTAKDIDWIETKLKRLSKTVEKFKATADNAYKSLSTRFKASAKEAKALEDSITANETALEVYQKKADSVKLSDGIKKLVREGAISIQEYSGEQQELISEYQTWYEKALDCKEAIDSLNASLTELYVTNFELIQKDAENFLSTWERAATATENTLSRMQAKGYADTQAYYSTMERIEYERMQALDNEAKSLEEARDRALANGEIEEYSEQWWEFENQILDVRDAWDEAATSVEGFRKEMRQIEWNRFDYLMEKFGRLGGESDYLSGLLDEEKFYDKDTGTVTNDWLTAQGLHVANYKLYLAEAQRYADEIKKLDKQISDDSYNKDLIARREELIDTHREMINAVNQETDAIKDLVKNGFNKQLEALKKVIDAYTDALDSAKEMHDYQKTISEKSTAVTNLQKQLAAYEGDTSEEVRSKVQKLRVDLEKAQEDLAETEYDHYISEQKSLLEDLYEDYELSLNARLNDTDTLISGVTQQVKDGATLISDRLTEIADTYGFELSKSMNTVWNGNNLPVNKALKGIESDVNKLAEAAVNTTMNEELIRMAASGKIASTSEMDINNDGIVTAEDARLWQNGKRKRYAKGGLIDYTGLAHVDGSPSSPELVLSAKDTMNFIKLRDYLRDISATSIVMGTQLPGYLAESVAQNIPQIITKYSPLSGFSAAGGFGSMTVNNEINIPIDHVIDYNDLVTQLRDDPKFEKMMEAMLFDKVVGRGSMNKYNIRW